MFLSMHLLVFWTRKSALWNRRRSLHLRAIFDTLLRRKRTQFRGRLLGILENAVGKNTEIEGRGDAHRERKTQSKRDPTNRDRPAGLPHVHHHNDAQVVVRADCTIQHSDEREPDQIRFYSRAENIELGEESAGHGNAD